MRSSGREGGRCVRGGQERKLRATGADINEGECILKRQIAEFWASAPTELMFGLLQRCMPCWI